MNTTSPTTAAPIVVTTIDDNGTQRIGVFGANRVEICGAFKPVDRPYWLIYVTKTIVAVVGRSQRTPIPHRLHALSQQDVQQWLELIAGLYLKAANQ